MSWDKRGEFLGNVIANFILRRDNLLSYLHFLIYYDEDIPPNFSGDFYLGSLWWVKGIAV